MSDRELPYARADELARLLLKIRTERETLKAEYEKAKKPLDKYWDQVAAEVFKFFERNGGNRIDTDYGRLKINRRPSATVKDGEAFMDYVIQNGAYELLERRAHIKGCFEWAREHGKKVPGVHLNVIRTISVLKSTEKDDDDYDELLVDLLDGLKLQK